MHDSGWREFPATALTKLLPENTNLKLSGDTFISVCRYLSYATSNEWLSQQSSAASSSPVSFLFFSTSRQMISCFSTFPRFKPHVETHKNHASFSPIYATLP